MRNLKELEVLNLPELWDRDYPRWRHPSRSQQPTSDALNCKYYPSRVPRALNAGAPHARAPTSGQVRPVYSGYLSRYYRGSDRPRAVQLRVGPGLSRHHGAQGARG
jgi:hypothetical protein